VASSGREMAWWALGQQPGESMGQRPGGPADCGLVGWQPGWPMASGLVGVHGGSLEGWGPCGLAG
jgi:hypothetical protein